MLPSQVSDLSSGDITGNSFLATLCLGDMAPSATRQRTSAACIRSCILNGALRHSVRTVLFKLRQMRPLQQPRVCRGIVFSERLRLTAGDIPIGHLTAVHYWQTCGQRCRRRHA